MPYKILYIANVRHRITEDVNRGMLLKLNWLVGHTDYEYYWAMTGKQEKQMAQSELLRPEVSIVRLDVEEYPTIGQASRVEKLVRSWKWRREYKSDLAKVYRKYAPDIVVTTLKHKNDILYATIGKGINVVEMLTDEDQLFLAEENIGTFSNRLMAYLWRVYRMSSIYRRLKKIQVIVVPSDGLVNKWKGNLSCVLHIPTPLSDIPDSISDGEAKQVMAVGTFDDERNFEQLLWGWRRLVAVYPEWKLRVYGSGDPSSFVELLKKLKMSRCVKYSPIPANLDMAYRQASIYVQDVRFDPQGYGLMEAMSYGLPCIASDAPYAPRDIISDGVNGFLSPEGHSMDFSIKLGLIMRKASLRKKMGEEAHSTSKEYHLDKIMPRWKQLFDDVILSMKKKK